MPKSENWANPTPRSSATVRRRENLTDLGNSLGLGLQRGVNSISLHPVICCLLWLRCLFDQLSISDFGGKWPLKWKFSKMSFQISWRDTKLRFVTKFGKNRPLQSCRKVAGITIHKKTHALCDSSQPHFCPKLAVSRPKFPERCHPLTCPGISNLVRIGCALPDLFRKDWFSAQKVNTI